MASKEPTHPDRKVLPQAVSDRVLARASELDAALRTGASVAELRTAAMEAGISEEAFEAALAEVQNEGGVARAAPKPRWWRRRWLIAASLIFLSIGYGVLMREVRAPAPPTPGEVVEEPILLRCLSFSDAAALLHPIVGGDASNIRFSTVEGGRVLIVRGTADQLASARATLANHEATLPACAVRSQPTKAP